MSTIGGDGGIRRALEPTQGAPVDAVSRARELARRLREMLDERNAQGPRETARLLVEVPRLPAEAQDTFLNAAGSEGSPRERAEAVRERIARAYPEASERRREVGAALVAMEGGEPRTLAASLLEAKVTGALDKLGALGARARTRAADAMERARGFGPFGGPHLPNPSRATQSLVLPEGFRAEVGVPLTVPEKWRPMVERAREMAPVLASGITSLGQAESTVAAVRRGLAQVEAGEGLWARARMAASEDAMGRIAARFDGLRDRLDGGFEEARHPGVARAEIFSAMAREARGEAIEARQEIAWARELVPDVELGPGVSAQSSLERAEAEMSAAEYGLQAYAAQQDMLPPPAAEQGAESADIVRGGGAEAPVALTPEMFTPEVIEQLRASGQVPPEIIAELESGEITPELLTRLQGPGMGRITQEELDRIGTGIEGSPAQGFWNIGTVGAGMDPAFSCDEYKQAATRATDAVLGENATSVRTIDGAELAAAIRDAGVPLEKVDPNQLSAALAYINTGASGAVEEFGRGAPQTVDEQRQRLAFAIRQFHCLAENGPPKMDRRLAIELCWSAARIPGHAFEKMSDAEVLAAAQQTAAACNTPGSHEFKIGKHTVKLTIGDTGAVESTSTNAPSFWSKLGKIAKVALTVCSFMPPPVGIVARCVQAGVALVNAVRNGGGFLDIVAAGASFVGAGAAAIGRIAGSAAGVAGNVARVANAVSGVARGVQGIQRGGIGGIISGVAGVAGGIAGGLQSTGAGAAANSSLGRVASGLSTAGRELGRVGAAVGAAEGYVRANRAVSEAREAVAQARATGDPATIQRAEQQLAQAERGRRSAAFGGLAAVGQVAGDTLSRNSAGQLDPRTGQVPTQGRSGFQVGAEIFSRGMNAARGVNEGDLLTAGVEALGGLAAARQGTREIAQEYVIGKDGERIPVGADRFQMTEDFDLLNQASSVADGLNNWRVAERGEGQAREAVDQAKEALERAQVSGNPEAIREAEANLREARQGLVQADLGSTWALDNAGERFTGAVDTLQNSRAADRSPREALRRASDRTTGELEQVIARRRAGGEPTSATAEAALRNLQRAQAELTAAEASGDPERIGAAARRLGDAEAVASAARDQVSAAVPGFASLRPREEAAPEGSTPAAPKPTTYKVRPGDNPTVIAARITEERAARGLPGISAQDIMEANGLTDATSRTLQPGQDLIIRDETLHPEQVITTAQLVQQRQGARSTQNGNVRVSAGESLERYAEMLGVTDKNAWMAEVRRRNPQLSADGRIYEGQVLDLPPGQNRVGFGSGPGGAATREVVPNSPSAQAVPGDYQQADLAQRRQFNAEDRFDAIRSELDSVWEDPDVIERNLADLDWWELQDLKAVAKSRGVDLQQMIIDNIQTDSDRDRLVAHLAGDHRAAANMGLRKATEDARDGFFPTSSAEDRQRVIDRMHEASDPKARAEAIALLEEQARKAETQVANSRRHGVDDKDLEHRASYAQTWVEQARAADQARSETEALNAKQEAEWQGLRAQGGTAEQAQALAEAQIRQRQLLGNQHQAGQAAFEFRRAVESGDRASMQRVLDSVADPNAFARSYAERYVPGILPGQLEHAEHFVSEQIRPYMSTQELDHARASLTGNTELRDAHRISAALDANLGITPDYGTIHDIQRNSTPEQWGVIQRYVQDLRGRSLADETRQMTSGVEGFGRSFFGTSDLTATRQMATGTYDVHAQIRHATAGPGTTEELLARALESPEFQALSDDQKARYREQLLGGPIPEVSGIDRLRTDFALRGAPRTPQEALQRQRAIMETEGSNVIHDSLSWLSDNPLANVMASTLPTTMGLVAAGRGVEWYLSDERERLDRSMAETDRFLAQVGEGPLSSTQQLEYNRLMREMGLSTQAYVQKRDKLADYAGMAATTVVGVGATIASGGTLAPALIALTAAGGAATNMGVRYAIRGSSTSLEDLGRDAISGGVNTGLALVGGSLGNAARARYVAGHGGEAALSWGQRALAGVAEGVPDGLIGGAGSGFVDTALADGTFDNGFVPGLGRSLQGGARGATVGTFVGGAAGAGMNTAGRALRGVLDATSPGSLGAKIDDYFHWGNNFGRGRPMATGAEVLERTSLVQIRAKHAAANAYAAIRNSTDDVAQIAKNTGLPESRIARIKEHVFNKVHQMDDGLRRFDPSPKIADAWKRLTAGTHTPRDLRLLKHELYESRFEGIFKTNYATAHDASKWSARRQWARAEGNATWREVGRLKAPQGGSATGGTGAVPPRHGRVPEFVRRRFEAGEDFNRINRGRYPFNEVEVLGPGGSTFKLDSYDPARNLIVFRRLTQFAEVQEQTAIKYLDEFLRKYPRGAVISDSPFNRAILRGKRLRGDLLFEVPVQTNPIPRAVLDAAAARGIIIRDVAGRVYS